MDFRIIQYTTILDPVSPEVEYSKHLEDYPLNKVYYLSLTRGMGVRKLLNFNGGGGEVKTLTDLTC